MPNYFYGKDVAKDMDAKLIHNIESKGLQNKICLAFLRVGEDPDDIYYENAAMKKLKKLGMLTKQVELPVDSSTEDVKKALEDLNQDASVHGILMFQPLPKQIDAEVIKYVIDEKKDIDCLHPNNALKLLLGEKAFVPCTARAVMEMLRFNEIKLSGMKALVIGRSMVVGKPLALMLLAENATVTIAHSRTKNMEQEIKDHELVISAVGIANYVSQDEFADNAIVIDVGINEDEDGKLCGDVDTKRVENHVAAISPVPGGVGSVTTSVLAQQVYEAYEMQQ